MEKYAKYLRRLASGSEGFNGPLLREIAEAISGSDHRASGEILVAITRGEGYEDVAPELVAEDALGLANPFAWRVVAGAKP